MKSVWLTLVPADSEDKDFRSPDRQRAINDVFKDLQGAQILDNHKVYFQKSAEGGSWLVGELLVHLGPHLITAVGAYLAGRAGRSVKMKLGDKEFEASSVEEIERLIELAKSEDKDADPPSD